jgi:hypothetical protein
LHHESRRRRVEAVRAGFLILRGDVVLKARDTASSRSLSNPGHDSGAVEAESLDLRSGTRRSAAAVTPRVEPEPMEAVSTSLMGAVKRTMGEFKKDNLSDWAAVLTYRGVMCVAPALLVVVAG